MINEPANRDEPSTTPLLKPRSLPSKHETLAQCWVNVGPASKTMGQHHPTLGTTSSLCWVYYNLLPQTCQTIWKQHQHVKTWKNTQLKNQSFPVKIIQTTAKYPADTTGFCLWRWVSIDPKSGQHLPWAAGFELLTAADCLHCKRLRECQQQDVRWREKMARRLLNAGTTSQTLARH